MDARGWVHWLGEASYIKQQCLAQDEDPACGKYERWALSERAVTQVVTPPILHAWWRIVKEEKNTLSGLTRPCTP